MTELHENIRTLRTRLGITQREFGASIGISAGQVSDYENGKVDVPAQIVYRLAEKYGISFDELFTGETESGRGYQAEFRVYKEQDRQIIASILVSNGYDVGQHKRLRSPAGRTVDYYIHITDRSGNLGANR